MRTIDSLWRMTIPSSSLTNLPLLLPLPILHSPPSARGENASAEQARTNVPLLRELYVLLCPPE
ncbi:ORF406 [White spot syndrome virus]|uniref:ORF406 n=1 Tax=White spot syndrome virus TaxID=342409 RepID=A0A2D3I6V6_9VIRU|nr:ORF406 [White spot syndrome virus]